MRKKVFIVWFAIFLLWSFYRTNFFSPEWVDEIIFKPLIFIVPVIYFVIVREKGTLKDLGLSTKPLDLMVDLYIGAFLGMLFAVEGLIGNYITHGGFSFLPIFASKIVGGVTLFFLLSIVTSVWEEILGRGFLYQWLLKENGDQFGAAFTSSFLLLMLHVPMLFTRLHLSGAALLVYPVSIILLGITNCYLLSLRKSLTLPILVHAFWNMTVALFL